MKSLVAAAVLGLFAFGASAQNTPVGLWKTIDDETKAPKALVRITEHGGIVTGKIEKVLAADAKPDAKCDKCEDDRKDKPIVGLEIIRDIKKDDDVWAGGTILDSAKGKVYKARFKPVEGGKKMEVRGYVAFFYRTQVWERVE